MNTWFYGSISVSVLATTKRDRMFKKLLSNLPFNPSLIGQVSFYAQRMHKETALRRTGLIILLLAIAVQMFAVITPPEPTLARSGNDIIEGGFTARDQAVLHCLNSSIDFRRILEYYGIGCDTVANAETVTIRSTDYSKKLDSMGRWPQGPTITRTGKPTDEYEVNISGTSYYMRNLWSWDSGAYSSYKVLRMKNKYGQTIMIMYSCGNIVTIDRYSPPAPPNTPKTPKPEIRKENSPSSMVSVGDEITYSLFYRNIGTGNMTHAHIRDIIPTNTELVSVNPGGDKHSVTGSRRVLDFWHDVPQEVIGASSTWYVVRYTVKVTSMPSDNNSICNTARFESDEAGVNSNEVCNFVRRPSAPAPSRPIIDLPSIPNIPGTTTTVVSKRARNVTQNIQDANNTTAKAGDEIQYTLSVKNTGTAAAKDFIIKETLGDVLEYADLKNIDNGVIDDRQVITWNPVTIDPGSTVNKTITVRVKDQIPNTPSSTSNPGSFDLVMTNVYGDTINIKLPATPIKTTEQTVQKLPNTGPGESMAIILILTVAVSYFFARSRLLAQEVDIVRTDFASSGGY
jgi:uncharacterized repeat protein (TIGR01451 family)